MAVFRDGLHCLWQGLRGGPSCQERFEAALARELAFEQVLLDAIPIPVFTKGIDGRYRGCNKAFQAALGLPRERIVGRTVFEIVPADKAAEFHATDLDLYRTGGNQTYETTMRYADGSMRRLTVVKGAFTDAGGAVAGYIGTLIDTTERRHAEEQLVRAARLATLGQTASEVAHELNQPLSIIRMAAENGLGLLDHEQPDRARLHRQLEIVSGQMARMSELVTHLRRFGRPQGDDRHPFRPAETVLAMARLMATPLSLDDIVLALDLPEDCPEILGSPHQVEQILLNLLGNARDAVKAAHAPGERRIAVSLAVDGDTLVLAIGDNGGGIAPEAREALFDPFFSTKGEDGTGLGLSICARLVSGMDGHIDAANTGDGARFAVTLPIYRRRDPAAPCAPAAPSPQPSAGARRRATVLVVDDEPLAVECISDYLEGRAYRVVSATGAREALALAAATPVDVVVSDIRMPGMGGGQLVEELRRRQPALPAVLMTGNVDIVTAPPDDSATVLVHKPVGLAALEAHIGALLDAALEQARP
ncbi:MAG: response regulator [Magnetospirillum sp.]|nr:response regulator [Magnetospirillum sp.]